MQTHCGHDGEKDVNNYVEIYMEFKHIYVRNRKENVKHEYICQAYGVLCADYTHKIHIISLLVFALSQVKIIKSNKMSFQRVLKFETWVRYSFT